MVFSRFESASITYVTTGLTHAELSTRYPVAVAGLPMKRS